MTAPACASFMARHERFRLTFPCHRRRRRRHQRALRFATGARRAARRCDSSQDPRLSRPRRSGRGGDRFARRAPAFAPRLRRRAGHWAEAQAHQRAVDDGRPRGGAAARPRSGAAVQRFRGAGFVAAGDSAGLGAADRSGRFRRSRPAGDSRPRHRLGDRRAGRGGRPPHAARFRGLPYRLRPGRRRGERAVAAPRARLRPGDDRERARRPRPGAGPCGAGRRARGAEADARRAGGRRRGARRSRRARRRRASGFTGASSPASPATWASPSSPPAA